MPADAARDEEMVERARAFFNNLPHSRGYVWMDVAADFAASEVARATEALTAEVATLRRERDEAVGRSGPSSVSQAVDEAGARTQPYVPKVGDVVRLNSTATDYARWIVVGGGGVYALRRIHKDGTISGDPIVSVDWRPLMFDREATPTERAAAGIAEPGRPTHIRVPIWDYPERRVLRWEGDRPVVPLADARTGEEFVPLSEHVVDQQWEPAPAPSDRAALRADLGNATRDAMTVPDSDRVHRFLDALDRYLAAREGR